MGAASQLSWAVLGHPSPPRKRNKHRQPRDVSQEQRLWAGLTGATCCRLGHSLGHGHLGPGKPSWVTKPHTLAPDPGSSSKAGTHELGTGHPGHPEESSTTMGTALPGWVAVLPTPNPTAATPLGAEGSRCIWTSTMGQKPRRS